MGDSTPKEWDHFQSLPDDHGLSLEELSRAYAELIARGDDPYQAAPDRQQIATASDQQPADELDDLEEEEERAGAVELEDESCVISPRSILEAMLFVGHPENLPLESRHVAALMRGVRPAEVDEMVRELNAIYTAQRCPYVIRSVGAGYRLELRGEFHPLRDKFYGRVKAARLSQACIDTLAIVAYNQPVTRDQVEQFRSRPSGGVLSQLVRRQLLKIIRTTNDGRKVSHYVTTDRFLEVFGLESLGELPQDQESDRDAV
jgi:segregation and condensation protein B